MRVVVSSSGRFHSLHLANQIRKHGALYRFYSSTYSKCDRSKVPEMLVDTNRCVGVADRFYIKFGLSNLISQSRWFVFRDSWFDHWVRGRVAFIGDFDLFVGWAHCSLDCIRSCHSRGVDTVIECGSMHICEQEKILKDAYESVGLCAPPIAAANKEKMLQEYQETDYISVPSEHVYKSFVDNGISTEKLIKVPYGIDVRQFSLPRTGRPEKFRVLFVGQVGVQKGVHLLLEAWRKFSLPRHDAELVIVGDLLSDGRKILKEFKAAQNIKVIGSVRHEKLGELYRGASVFVLPSLQEGLAMVIGEAMASGLPVICSTRTGAQEIVRDGEDGFIIDVGDVDALAERILWCFENQDACFDMGREASLRAQEFTWERYGEKMMAEYNRVLDGGIN